MHGKGTPEIKSQRARRGLRLAQESSHQTDTLARQETTFPVKTAGEAARAAARGEDAVARHQDRDRVRTTGAPHRSRRFGPANPAGHLAVTEGPARRDVSQLPPNLLLERGAG